jgi:hypothetical protein
MGGTALPPHAPLILLFERNDAVAVPLIPQLRTAGYDVRAARIPVEVFDLLQREPIDLVLIDLGNAAANRREFWVGLDSQRRVRTVHVLTFRYMPTGETGELESGLRVARADVEVQSAQGFGVLIDAIRTRVPGAIPVPQFNGPAPAMPFLSAPAPQNTPRPAAAGNPLAPQAPARNGNGPARPYGAPADDDASPFAQPYSNNPFKSAQPAAPPQPDPVGPRRNGNGAGPAAPGNGNPPRPGAVVDEYAGGFGPRTGNGNGQQNGRNAPPAGRARGQPIDDAWTPPDATAAPRRGIAYRGYEDEPLAPDDPRIEGNTSQVPVVAYRNADHDGRSERALSTILADGAVMAPQRLDALRSIQQTLSAIGMDFSLGDLAMLFKFLTPDQLLAALLVSRGIVNAEEIASLGRIKQELLATGKDYDLETLLVMFDVLPADEVRALRAELE